MLIEPGSNSGGVDPTTDSDRNEVYDEGISKSWVEVSGAVGQDEKKTETFFYPGEGIDDMVGDDRARIDISEFVFDDSNAMDVTFGIKASESEDGTDPAAQDEKASEGERFFDIKFVDSARNVNSVAGVTG